MTDRDFLRYLRSCFTKENDRIMILCYKENIPILEDMFKLSNKEYISFCTDNRIFEYIKSRDSLKQEGDPNPVIIIYVNKVLNLLSISGYDIIKERGTQKDLSYFLSKSYNSMVSKVIYFEDIYMYDTDDEISDEDLFDFINN